MTAAFDALVLAGGRSSRMGGVGKLGLVVDGETLLAHACAAVSDARRLVVVGPPGQPGTPDGAIGVQEDPPFAGPAAAMSVGLSVLGGDPADRVVVLAGDVPRAREAVPALLAACDQNPNADGVVARSSDGHRQPLVAIYRRAALGAALAAHEPLANGSVMRVIADLRLVEIDIPDDVLADVDTPADLQRLTEEPRHG
ncbi:MAG: molybdenum cofactor guanylyltransferase [Aeromicrobium sp.]